MAPGTEEEPLAFARFEASPLLAQAAVVLDRALQEQVVPPSRVQAFHGHLPEVVPHADGFPIVVVALVLDPVPVVGRDLAGNREVQKPEALHGQGRGPVSPSRRGPGEPAGRVLRQDRRPARGEPLHEGPRLVRPALVVFGRGHVGEDRGEVRRVGGRGQHLGRPDVGPSEHADLAVRIGQGRRPLHGIVAVPPLAAERVELALRVVPPARVLEHDHVTVRREQDPRPGLRAVVGRALEQDGKLPGSVGPVDVGHEAHAVPHGHAHARLHRDPVVSHRHRGGRVIRAEAPGDARGEHETLSLHGGASLLGAQGAAKAYKTQGPWGRLGSDWRGDP